MRTRREYTKEFKEDAVGLAKERDNISQAARDLGISPSVLRRWKREHEEGYAFPGKGKPRDEEMATLKRELKRIKEENEILKNGLSALHLPVYKETPTAVFYADRGERPIAFW